MMKLKTRKAFAAALAACCFCCTAGMTASAATLEDIVNKAREVGIPEAQIQVGYNEWMTGDYTQEDLDTVYESLLNYDAQTQEMLDQYFGTTGDSSSSSADNTTSSAADSTTSSGETTSATENSTAGTESAGNSTASTESSSTVTSTDFINMTLDEKIAYVGTMNAADKEAFLNNLSPAERNSIIKQLALDDKAALMQGYINVAEQMGMHVAVDNLTDDNISVTIRDEEGIVIDKTAVGITIDETGISHTGLFAAAAAGIVLAVGGLLALYRYICRSDEQMQ